MWFYLSIRLPLMHLCLSLSVGLHLMDVAVAPSVSVETIGKLLHEMIRKRDVNYNVFQQDSAC